MITPEKVTLIKKCWSGVTSAQKESAFIDSFYQYLFTQHPGYKKLFPENKEHLSMKLLETLNQVINGLEHFDFLKSAIRELGQRHQNLNIAPAMYRSVCDCTLLALNTVLDHQLSQDEKDCWVEAFDLISETMISAYK